MRVHPDASAPSFALAATGTGGEEPLLESPEYRG